MPAGVQLTLTPIPITTQAIRPSASSSSLKMPAAFWVGALPPAAGGLLLGQNHQPLGVAGAGVLFSQAVGRADARVAQQRPADHRRRQATPEGVECPIVGCQNASLPSRPYSRAHTPGARPV